MGVTLGFCYRASPVICSDEGTRTWEASLDYRPSGAPGCLAPHLWLEDGASLYDLFGPGLTLLAFGEAAAECFGQARAEADVSGIPLQTIRLGDADLQALYGAPLALVRPDQIIAWRGELWPGPSLFGHVTLVRSERSAIAALVTDLLEAGELA